MSRTVRKCTFCLGLQLGVEDYGWPLKITNDSIVHAAANGIEEYNEVTVVVRRHWSFLDGVSCEG